MQAKIGKCRTFEECPCALGCRSKNAKLQQYNLRELECSTTPATGRMFFAAKNSMREYESRLTDLNEKLAAIKSSHG